MSDVDMWRLVTVTLFLGVLLVVWYFVTRNKTHLAGKIAGDRVMRLRESLNLGPDGRAFLLDVDGHSIMAVTSKRGATQLLDLGKTPDTASEEQA